MKTVRRARIIGENGETLYLNLRKDGDRYAWLEESTDNSCELSARTIKEAIQFARVAWRSWEFALIPLAEN